MRGYLLNCCHPEKFQKPAGRSLSTLCGFSGRGEPPVHPAEKKISLFSEGSSEQRGGPRSGAPRSMYSYSPSYSYSVWIGLDSGRNLPQVAASCRRLPQIAADSKMFPVEIYRTEANSSREEQPHLAGVMHNLHLFVNSICKFCI